MSDRDLVRVSVLSRMKSGELTSVEGAELLAVSVRQVKRLKKRYVAGGARGIRHALVARSRSVRELWTLSASATVVRRKKEPARDSARPWLLSSSRRMRD